MNKEAWKRILFLLTLLICISFYACDSEAQMSPKEMLQKADEARGSLEGIKWDISMDSLEMGRRQYRKLQATARGYDSLIVTLEPSNVKGQQLLMRDRNMWFAKPGLSKAVPISPRQKLMGSAANGDIAATNYAGDYKIIKTEDDRFNDEPCLVMYLKAVDSRATYDQIKYWVSKERLVGLKAEFFTVSGKMFKSATFEYNNSVKIGGKPRAFISRMTINSAVMKDDVTVVNFSKPLLKNVSDAVFNLNLLTR